MDAMEKTQRLNRTIPCPNCGELYVITYKRCPFCGGGNRKKQKAEAAQTKRDEGNEQADLQARDVLIETVEETTPSNEQTASVQAQPVQESAVEAAPASIESDEGPGLPAEAEAAAPPSKTPYFVSELDLGEIDYGADIDWTPVLEEEDPMRPTSENQRGGKRLARKSGFRWGRFFGILISLLLIAAAAYIVVTRVVPIVQAKLDERSAAQQQQEDKPKVEPTATDPTASFRLSDTKLTMTKKGDTKQLSAVYEGEGSLGSLKWESSDDAVVRVSSSGNVSAVAAGSAMITATRTDGSKAQCEINCVWDENEPIANLSLNRTDFTLNKGATFSLEVIGTQEAVKWVSDDPAIATVSETGVVKNVGTGRTKITATIGTEALTCFVSCK